LPQLVSFNPITNENERAENRQRADSNAEQIPHGINGQTPSIHQNRGDHHCHQYDGAGPYKQHHSPVLRVKQVSASSGIAPGPRPINEKVF
jgi:hypothetical protein